MEETSGEQWDMRKISIGCLEEPWCLCQDLTIFIDEWISQEAAKYYEQVEHFQLHPKLGQQHRSKNQPAADSSNH